MRPKIINHASAAVMFFIDSRQMLVGFDAKNSPAGVAGDAQEESGTSLEGGF